MCQMRHPIRKIPKQWPTLRLPEAATGVTKCDRYLQNYGKMYSPSRFQQDHKQISKNRKWVISMLLYWYVRFETVTICCCSYRKSLIFFCITRDTTVCVPRDNSLWRSDRCTEHRTRNKQLRGYPLLTKLTPSNPQSDRAYKCRRTATSKLLSKEHRLVYSRGHWVPQKKMEAQKKH
jgi:hypothetical protein